MTAAIRLFSYDDLASTTTTAAQLLAAGQVPPFGVVAAVQLAGRGQRGRQWQSPAGGLYITLVLPASAASFGRLGLIPLRAASVLATWLVQEVGVRVRLKWPNDLYWGGRKLGGMLCEASFSGQVCGPLFISLGLNRSHAPRMPPQEGQEAPVYDAIALADILADPPTPRDLAASLTAHFWDLWHQDPDRELLARYRDFHLGPGQVWLHTAPPYLPHREVGVDDDGQLVLSGMHQEQLSLATATHDFRWYYQAPASERRPLAVADLNHKSSAQLALFADRYDHEPAYVWPLSGEDPRLDAQACAALALCLTNLGVPDGAATIFTVGDDHTIFWSLQQSAQPYGLYTQSLRVHAILGRLPTQGMPLTDREIVAREGWLSALTSTERQRVLRENSLWSYHRQPADVLQGARALALGGYTRDLFPQPYA